MIEILGKLLESLGIKIDLKEINFIKIENHQDNRKYVYVDKSKNLIVNPKEAPGGKFNEFVNAVVEDKNSLVEENAQKQYKELAEVEERKDNQEVIKFYEKKIPSEDVLILRAALYINEKHKKGENIDGMKHSISIKYGKRGRNIVNLCSAGYFHQMIRDLYIHLEEVGMEKEFSFYYENIVTELDFAVFVHRNMNISEINSEIKHRIKNSIDFLDIHALGEENVRKVKESIDMLQKKNELTSYAVSTEEKVEYILVKLTKKPV